MEQRVKKEKIRKRLTEGPVTQLRRANQSQILIRRNHLRLNGHMQGESPFSYS